MRTLIGAEGFPGPNSTYQGHSPRRLLPMSNERQRCRTAKQRDELPPPHSITSSIGVSNREAARQLLTLAQSPDRWLPAAGEAFEPQLES
jgi:hypothetical protein